MLIIIAAHSNTVSLFAILLLQCHAVTLVLSCYPTRFHPTNKLCWGGGRVLKKLVSDTPLIFKRGLEMYFLRRSLAILPLDFFRQRFEADSYTWFAVISYVVFGGSFSILQLQ